MSAGASYEEFKKHCQESGTLFLVLKTKKISSEIESIYCFNCKEITMNIDMLFFVLCFIYFTT